MRFAPLSSLYIFFLFVMVDDLRSAPLRYLLSFSFFLLSFASLR